MDSKPQRTQLVTATTTTVATTNKTCHLARLPIEIQNMIFAACYPVRPSTNPADAEAPEEPYYPAPRLDPSLLRLSRALGSSWRQTYLAQLRQATLQDRVEFTLPMGSPQEFYSVGWHITYADDEPPRVGEPIPTIFVPAQECPSLKNYSWAPCGGDGFAASEPGEPEGESLAFLCRVLRLCVEVAVPERKAVMARLLWLTERRRDGGADLVELPTQEMRDVRGREAVAFRTLFAKIE